MCKQLRNTVKKLDYFQDNNAIFQHANRLPAKESVDVVESLLENSEEITEWNLY